MKEKLELKKQKIAILSGLETMSILGGGGQQDIQNTPPVSSMDPVGCASEQIGCQTFPCTL